MGYITAAKLHFQHKSMEDRVTKYRVACILRKCTPEIIEKLQELGYEKFSNIDPDFSRHKVIVTYKFGAYMFYEEDNIAPEEKRRFIDCGTNETEFFLLAGIQNNDFKNRVFLCKPTYWQQKATKWGVNTKEEKDIFFRVGWKEAKPEEIVVCFADGTGDTIDTIECIEGNEKWFERLKMYVGNASKEILYR